MRSDPDEGTKSVYDEHSGEGAQCIWRLHYGDHRSSVVHHRERNRRDQQRTAEHGSDDPTDDEPGTLRRGDLGGTARCRPHHQSSRCQWQHTQLLAGDRDRHQMGGKPDAGNRSQGSRQVTVGDHQLDECHRSDDDQGNQGRAEGDPHQVSGLWGAGWGRKPALNRCHSARFRRVA